MSVRKAGKSSKRGTIASFWLRYKDKKQKIPISNLLKCNRMIYLKSAV